jgi:hypothetical protein
MNILLLYYILIRSNSVGRTTNKSDMKILLCLIVIYYLGITKTEANMYCYISYAVLMIIK